MKSNYRRIGDFIRKVNVRNKDLKVKTLYGLSMSKEFRVSTSNTVGTNMANYKIMHKYQFACDFMSPIRVDKLPVVLKLDDEPNLVSPAYPVFEVIDRSELDPEYLMMWFRRPEFDRFVSFKCDAAIRGGYGWDEFCDTTLPVPSIGKQRAIVQEYNTVVNRIQLNEQLNQKLEETAQALYKHWFVDFEFPISAEYAAAVGKPELEGQPYQSSGGEMVYNEELDQEIPEGWDAGALFNYVKLSQGQVINAKTRHLVVEDGLPLLKITDLFNGTATMFIDPEKVNKKNIATTEDLIYTRTGQVGYIFRNKTGVVYNNCFKIIPVEEQLSREYLYWFFKDRGVRNLMVELASGSAQADLTHSAFLSVPITEPDAVIQNTFSLMSKKIYDFISINEGVSYLLQKLEMLLLSRMTEAEIK